MDSYRERVQRFPVSVTAPAAGADVVILSTGSNVSPPGQGIWRVLSLAFRFTTSAAVVNRFVRLVMDDTNVTYWQTQAADLQAASTQRNYAGFDGSTGALNSGLTEHFAWLNGGLILFPGHRLRTVTVNMDPADQIDQVAMMVEELPSGRYFQTFPAEPLLAEPWPTDQPGGGL